MKIPSPFVLLLIAALVNSLWFNQTWAEGKNTPPETITQKEDMPENLTANILDTARLNKDLSTFVSAVEAGGLEETLQGDGPLTVFAPTNAAFDALPKGAIEALLDPAAKDQLSIILKYHIVYGAKNSENFGTETITLDTIGGQKIKIDGANGIKINRAKLVATDDNSDNGVIHIIDAVLIPPAN